MKILVKVSNCRWRLIGFHYNVNSCYFWTKFNNNNNNNNNNNDNSNTKLSITVLP